MTAEAQCLLCHRKHKAHGLCKMHHWAWCLAGHPELAAFIAERKTRPRTRLPRSPRYCVICGRKHQAHGLCAAHVCRWNAANRPALAAFIAAQRKGPPIRRRRSDAGPCYVCGRPAIGCQLCRPHYPRWRRAGRPRLDLFALSERTAPSPPPRPTAQAPPCHLCGRPGRTRGLCGSHYSMWLQARRPPLDDFIETHSARRALQSAGILQTLIERNPTT